MNISLLLFFGILLVSLILTMVGLGGGLVFSPLFLLLGFAKSDAASASLFLNLVAVASAAYTYARNQMIDFSLSIPLIIASAVAAPVGAYLNMSIDRQLFLMVLAMVLALAGGRMLITPTARTDAVSLTTPHKVIGGIVIGAVIGLIGGLLGIGGGVFVVPLLIFVLRTPTKIAAASSTFIVCFSSLTGFLGYASMAAVNWLFILPAAAAAFIGGQIGSRVMSGGMKGKTIRVIFSIILFLLCAKLLYQAIRL